MFRSLSAVFFIAIGVFLVAVTLAVQAQEAPLEDNLFFESGGIGTDLGIEIIQTPDVGSGVIAENTGVVSTNTVGSTENSGATSAPVLRAQFHLQIPTYFLEKLDTERDVFTCDPAQPICKVNLDFSPTMNGESSSAWSCELDFGMGVATGEEAKCNPNTVVLTGTTLAMHFRAWRKGDSSIQWHREIQVTVRASSESASLAGTGSMGSGSGSIDTPSGTGALDGTGSSMGIGSIDTPSGTGALDGTGSSSSTGSSETGSSVSTDTGVVLSDTGATNDEEMGTSSGTVEERESSGGIFTGQVVFSGTEVDNPVTESGSSSFSGENIATLFPMIMVQSGLDSQGRCTKSDCVVNFVSSLSGSAYICLWNLGGGTFSSATSSGSCNPSYAHFLPNALYRVQLMVQDKAGHSGSTIFEVLNPFVPSVTTTVIERTTVEAPSSVVAFAPVAHIAIQGRLSSQKWVDGKTTGCIVSDEKGCSFNFDGRSSVVVDASAASYVWDFGFGSGASGVNPPAVYFPVGTWRVRLSVADKNGFSTDEWKVEVTKESSSRTVAMTGVVQKDAPMALGFGSGEMIASTGSLASQPVCGYLSDGTTWACAAPKKSALVLESTGGILPFSVKISAQGPWGAGRSFSGGTYRCVTKEESCSVNFVAETAGGKSIKWEWEMGGTTFSGANPPAHEFKRGTSEVKVIALQSNGFLASDTVRVVVQSATVLVKKPTSRTLSKNSTSSQKSNTKTSATVMDAGGTAVFSAEPQGPLEANTPLGWAALAAAGSSGVSWLLARRWGK